MLSCYIILCVDTYGINIFISNSVLHKNQDDINKLYEIKKSYGVMESPIALVSVGLFSSSYELQNHFILEMEKYLYHTYLHVFIPYIRIYMCLYHIYISACVYTIYTYLHVFIPYIHIYMCFTQYM